MIELEGQIYKYQHIFVYLKHLVSFLL